MTDRKISREVLDAVGRYTKFHILAELNLAFARSGMTLSEMTARLSDGWSEEMVKCLLTGDITIHVEPLGEALFAINGSVVKMEVRKEGE